MPDAAWKKANRGETWTTGDSFNYGIGQGFTLASPLQLAVMSPASPAAPRVDAAADPRRRRRAGAASTPAAPLAIDPEHLRVGARRHVRGLERGHRLPLAHRRPGDADGRQDRHQPGAHHHRRRARRRRHQERAAALEPPRPCALRRLRALRPARATRSPRSSSTAAAARRSAAPIARDILLYALYGGLPPLEAYPAEQRTGDRGAARALQRRAEPPPASRPRAGPGMSLSDAAGRGAPRGVGEAPGAQLGAGRCCSPPSPAPAS